MTLADYSLSPDVAIVDPQFVLSMPKVLTVDTGIDCLTHALEAGVSNYASPYTDSNAMQAIRLVFKYLPIAYEHPRNEEARCMMHNAACIAALGIFERVSRRESRAGTCVRRALPRGTWPGQRVHAATRHGV